MCVIAIIPVSIILFSPSRPMLRHSVKPASWRTVEKPLTFEESIHNIASINMPVCILCMSVWYVMYWCYGLKESTPQPSDEMTVFKETMIVYIAHPHSLVLVN